MNFFEKEFYRQNATELAPQLLGSIISVQSNEFVLSAKIVETEAYCGAEDKGNHAYLGRRSPRNESMYLDGGHIYVYKCYGVHDMLNIVSGKSGDGQAVLIRAVEPIEGKEAMQLLRQCDHHDYRLTGGPGKVCTALGINKSLDGINLLHNICNIQIIISTESCEISTGPRVGMSVHVGECSNWHRRYFIKGNKFVSRPLNVLYNWG